MRHIPLSTRKILLSGILGIVSLGTVATPGFAQEPDTIHRMSRSMLHEQIGRAIMANDYEAFAEIIADKPGAKAVTQKQFEALVQANILRQAGKYSEAQRVLRKLTVTSPVTK